MISAGDRYSLIRRNGLGRGGRALARDMGDDGGLTLLGDRIYETNRAWLRVALPLLLMLALIALLLPAKGTLLGV